MNDYKNSTSSSEIEFDAIVPPDGSFAMGGQFTWMTSPTGVDFVSCQLDLKALPADFKSSITGLYF